MMNSPASIVARFLNANHYTQTLEAFLQEAGIPEEAATSKPGDWSLEQILSEKKQFDTSVQYQKSENEGVLRWTLPAPSQPNALEKASVASNVLFVRANSDSGQISVTTSDRKWIEITGLHPHAATNTESFIAESPILFAKELSHGFSVSASMSGQIALHDKQTHEVVCRRRDHQKYVVMVATYELGSVVVVATAGWDQKIIFYTVDTTALNRIRESSGEAEDLFGEPAHIQTLQSNPESLLFMQNPDTSTIYLLASRRDSTYLLYYRVARSEAGKLSITEEGKQNLAPHSNAWIAFTPCSLISHPTDPTLIAVATSSLPHMKLIVVRLLFPESGTQTDRHQVPRTQNSAARAELALQDREDAAIKLHITTMAPQTPYSTPQVVWRPDGSGLFVNGDDGVIRGIEAVTGKIVAHLKGHEAMSKVRTLWAGMIKKTDGTGEEVLVSGGFDKKVFVWTVAPS